MQDLGFAEADPTADVEGHDVQAKIAILSKLAFGVYVPFASVPTVGISSITSVDFAYAKTLKVLLCWLFVRSFTFPLSFKLMYAPLHRPPSNCSAPPT